jgi:hypothetical protein
MADEPLPPAVLQVEVTDRSVLVLECDEHLTHEIRARLRAELATVWPAHTILVLDKGMRLRVLTNTSVEVEAAPS